MLLKVSENSIFKKIWSFKKNPQYVKKQIKTPKVAPMIHLNY
jgi:hypothetical protein